MRAPCLGCGDRRLGCHARCERYQAFRAECEQIREKRREDAEMDAVRMDRAERRRKHGGDEWKRDQK